MRSIVSLHKMRTISIAAAIGLLATGAFAQSLIIPRDVPNFRERLSLCVGKWEGTPLSARGTMTYRQYTTKCLQGQPARPINAVASCRNGTTSPATAPEGACAFDGGVDRWLE
ncbi:MAG: hypothetical protein ACJ8IR_03910 [Alphaproteobacteria bacterium]|jgi:hypothetical protein